MPVPFLRETRATIRRRIGYLLFGRNRFLYGQLSSGGTTSFVLPLAKRYPDNSLVGRTVYVVSGTGTGQYAVCTGSTQATGTVTVSPTLGVAVDGTSVVELWPELLNPDDVNGAIERAILRVSDILNVYQSVQPSSLLLQGTTTTILGLVPPATLVRVASVRYQDLGYLWHEYFPAEWQNPNYGETFILANNAIYLTPRVDSNVYPLASWLIRGYRLPVLPTSDSDVVEVPSDYCVFYSAAMLDAQMAEGQAMDPEQHSGRAANWLREAAVIEARMGTNWLPNTVEIPW